MFDLLLDICSLQWTHHDMICNSSSEKVVQEILCEKLFGQLVMFQFFFHTSVFFFRSCVELSGGVVLSTASVTLVMGGSLVN